MKMNFIYDIESRYEKIHQYEKRLHRSEDKKKYYYKLLSFYYSKRIKKLYEEIDKLQKK